MPADLERVPGGAYGWFEQIAEHIGRGGPIIYEWKYKDRSRAQNDKVSLGKRILSKKTTKTMETEETKTVGLTKDGSYQFGLRKTFRVSPGVAWDYLFTKEGLSIWLGHVDDPEEIKLNETYRTEEGIEGKLTTFKPYSHFRMSWKKPAWRNSTILQVRVLDNKGKATVAIHHEKLLDGTQRDEVEVYWNNVMDKLGLKFGD